MTAYLVETIQVAALGLIGAVLLFIKTKLSGSIEKKLDTKNGMDIGRTASLTKQKVDCMLSKLEELSGLKHVVEDNTKTAEKALTIASEALTKVDFALNLLVQEKSKRE